MTTPSGPPIDPKQEHLDQRATTPRFRLVEDDNDEGQGMSADEIAAFLAQPIEPEE